MCVIFRLFQKLFSESICYYRPKYEFACISTGTDTWYIARSSECLSVII